jgi:hypothetical protein
MNLESKQLPYKKVDGIYENEEELSKWQKFWLKIGRFFAEGVAGHWEAKINIKF